VHYRHEADPQAGAAPFALDLDKGHGADLHGRVRRAGTLAATVLRVAKLHRQFQRHWPLALALALALAVNLQVVLCSTGPLAVAFAIISSANVGIQLVDETLAGVGIVGVLNSIVVIMLQRVCTIPMATLRMELLRRTSVLPLPALPPFVAGFALGTARVSPRTKLATVLCVLGLVLLSMSIAYLRLEDASALLMALILDGAFLGGVVTGSATKQILRPCATVPAVLEETSAMLEHAYSIDVKR